MEIYVHDILVGDVLYITLGDVVPADGVFISGQDVVCDESSITGKSGPAKKTPGDLAVSRIEEGRDVDNLDPFIVSGTRVLEGVGTYLVTSVGQHSRYGKLTVATMEASQTTSAVTAVQPVFTFGVILLLLLVTPLVKLILRLQAEERPTAAIENSVFPAYLRGGGW